MNLAGKHVMLDTETWGVRPGCAIRSIGAVAFDFSGKMTDAFAANITTTSCVDANLEFDPGTLDYWRRQNVAVEQAFLVDQKPLGTVLKSFGTWLRDMNRPTIWADGSYFDFPILDAAFAAAKLPTPWRAPDIRDQRTVLELFGFDARDMPPPPEPRTAWNRARFQAQCLVVCLTAKSKPQAVIEAPPRNVFG